MRNSSLPMLVVFGASLGLGACASTSKPLDPARIAQIERACKDVMGYRPGETLYMNCVGSLRETVASLDDGSIAKREAEVRLRTEHVGRACEMLGLASDLEAFNHCVQNLYASTEPRLSAQDN